MKQYKLEYLIEKLNLNGQNSHMADEDVLATYELAKYCRKEATKHLDTQYDFFQRKDVSQVVDELCHGYKKCYELTKSRLYELQEYDNEYVFVKEMKELSDMLSKICEFRFVDKFELILSYLNQDVISKDEPNALKAQFEKHLMGMSTYREADLCSSSNFKEKLFVSTVHKAKGLEFENVIVMRAVNERYPHFAHTTIEKQEEDKRLFYVAISRAMKRLIVSGSSSKGFTPFIEPILHRFTLRFSFSNQYLIEVGTDELRILEKGKIIRKYININKIYSSEKIRNQFDLKNYIYGYCNGMSDLTDKVDGLFKNIGILPEPIK